MSPYFFTWAAAAVHTYYVEEQLESHRRLLEAVRTLIAQSDTQAARNATSDGSHRSDETALDEFARLFAGQPVIYGVCLQHQHVDLQRFPQTLDIRNGHRPFLYRSVLLLLLLQSERL